VNHLQLLDTLGHAVIATDTNGVIKHWNGPASDLYGWTRDEVLGHNIVDVTPSMLSREQAAEIMAALAAGQAWSGTFPVRNRAGKEFSVCVTDLPISGPHDEVAGIVGVSAMLAEPSPLKPLLARVVAAANVIWPERTVLRIGDLDERKALVPDPHVIQLLAILLDRELRGSGSAVELLATAMTPQICKDFHMIAPFDGVYIHIGPPVREGTTLADAVVRSSLFVQRLVGAAGGRLGIGATASHPPGAHLFLPLRDLQIQ
jgi:PAS domain S-box-containing protein